MLRIVLILFGSSAIIVGLLGFRGQISTNRPWHIFLDMKYQARYNSLGQSEFFADGRSARAPVDRTIPYLGSATRADAGDLRTGPNPDFLATDPTYYLGRITVEDRVEKRKRIVFDEEVQRDKDGNELKGKDGAPIKKKVMREEEYEERVPNFVERIPPQAAQVAGGWKRLMERGRERYSIHCAACHGLSGYGGGGETAHGIVGRYGMPGIANYHDPHLQLAEKPDGYLFDVITHGVKSMASYGHQVNVHDRWAIVAYVRALQLSQNAPEPVARRLMEAKR